jgi:GAF domain-containing protein
MPSEVSTVAGDQSVEALRRELAEARDQQAATAEILAAISNSPTDPYRVFADIAASAARLCDAYDATIHQVDGVQLRLVAHYGPIRTGASMPLVRGALVGRAVLERRGIQIADLSAERTEYPQGSDAARRLGFRTTLAIPLIRAGDAIGVIAIRRIEVRPFADRQIELLKTFADQAVIAIENTRLFEELQMRTREVELRSAELAGSLEYQMATSEVLDVIARAPGNAAPVFNSIVETARRLCNAERATLHLKLPDGLYSPEATSGPPLQTLAPQEPVPVDRGSIVGRVALEGRGVQVDDIQADPEFTYLRTSATDRRRTMLGIPMLRDGTMIGAISISRSEVKAFTEREIALLKTFADQAVIAIENTRLFEAERARTRELQKALEQQAATSKILSVISGSPGELEPVFDTILKSARQLCAAEFGHLLLFNGETWRPAALHNVPKPYADWWNRASVVAGPETNLGRVQRTGRPDQVADVRVGKGYTARTPLGIATVELGGARTLLSVPLLKEGAVIGSISLYRAEVRPFDDGQIELLSSFADQAVIAIENARLLNELRESLAQQTATSEVLKVISSSPGMLEPVFQATLENATRICQAQFGNFLLYDGTMFRIVSTQGAPAEWSEYRAREPVVRPSPSHPLGRLASTKELQHIADIRIEQSYLEGDPEIIPIVELGGARTALCVPLLKDDELVRRNDSLAPGGSALHQ